MVQKVTDDQSKLATLPTPPLPEGRISYEEFLQWADEETWAEWVDGEIVLMSPVNKLHAALYGFLHGILIFFVSARQLGVLFSEPFQMKTGPELPGRSPDLFFVASQNLGRVKELYLDGPADLVVEIVSPDSRARDTVEKLAEYERGGVREYWLIDPFLREATFLVLGEEGRYRVATVEEGVFRSEVLAGLWLRVEWLWQEPLPPVPAIVKEWGLL